MKKWITFDLDGTLMQNPFVRYVFPEIESRVLAELDESYPVISALVEEHERRMALGQIVEAYDWDHIVKTHLETRKLSLAIPVEEIVIKHSTPQKIYLLEEGLQGILQKLQTSGYSLAAVTNGFYKYQYPVMKELGLLNYFEKIITPEQAGCGKPDPKILDSLFEEGDVIAHVGDRLDHDVGLAYSVGIASIWIYPKLPEELKDLKPRERAQHEQMSSIYWQKWQSETKNRGVELPLGLRPQHVIHSIQELLTIV